MFRGVRGVPRPERLDSRLMALTAEGRLLPPLLPGMLKSGSLRSSKVGVPRHSEASERLQTPRNTSTNLRLKHARH